MAATTCLSLHLPVDDKGFVDFSDREALFTVLRSKPENRLCFDCGARQTSWISTSFGIYLCLNCSGNHRSLGSKVSFVRSCELDNLKLEECLRMEIGGNGRAREYFRSHSVMDGKSVDYRSKICERYKKQLEKEVNNLLAENRPEVLRPAAPVLKLVVSSEVHEKEEDEDVERESSEVVVKRAQVLEETSGRKKHFGSASANPIKLGAKLDEFDFDFDSCFVDSKPAKMTTSASSPSVNKEVKVQSIHKVPSDGSSLPWQPKRDLASAKSISADDFNTTDESVVSNSRLAKFKNATAISSDALMGNDAEESFGQDRAAKIQLDKALQRAADVASVAQEHFKNAASWFVQISHQGPNS